MPGRLGGGPAMPDARSVVRVKRQRHRAAQGAEIQLQWFIGCHGVRSLCGKERSASAGSGRPSVNKPKPARPRFSAWWPPAARAIPGDSSMERQRTLHVGIRADNADAAADVRGQACDCTASAPTVKLSPGDSSIGIHGRPLHGLVSRLTCWRAGLAAARCAAWRLLVVPAYPAFGPTMWVVAVRLAERVPVAGLSWPRH